MTAGSGQGDHNDHDQSSQKQFKRRRKGSCEATRRAAAKMIEANQVISDDESARPQLARRRGTKLMIRTKVEEGKQRQQQQRQDICGSPGLVVLINLICSLTLTSLGPQVHCSTLSDFDGATFYKATQGSRIRIACNASNWQDDSVSLILWFKGSIGGGGGGGGASGSGRQSASTNNNYNAQPIYTIDARQRSLTSGQARHLVADSYRGRARFVIPSGQTAAAMPTARNLSIGTTTGSSNLAPYLELAPLEADDQGEFRCRVDYRSRPRENFLMILFVLVPPSKVEIMDPNGRSLEQIYGPLNESSDLTLVCRSKGGRPPPALSWSSAAGKVIDESYLTISDYLALQMSATGRPSYIAASGGPSDASRAPQRAPNVTEQQEKLLSLLSEAAGELEPADKNLRAAMGAHWPASSASSSPSPSPSSPISAHSSPEPPPPPAGSSISSGSDWHQQWSVWAELDYFGRLLASELDQQQEGATTTTTTTTMEPLLEFKVDETITTAANVLHINELSRELLASLIDGAHRTGEPVAPRLECRASNLHYDLRTLIKMFAPPSLVGAPPARGPPSGGSQRRGPTARLVEAIEGALEASMRSQRQPQTQTLLANSSGQLSQPLVSQIRLDSPLGGSISGAISVAGGPSAGATSADAGTAATAVAAAAAATDHDRWTHEQRPTWPNVIYQQLVRPHQLSAAGSGQEEPPAMVRSRLIALDAQLRPLDVKIVGPQRPLAASGQASEFGCVSSGSRPPARLTWLKNGRRLDPKLWRQAESARNASAASTTSKLLIKLEPEDHGAQLTCRAENPAKGAAAVVGHEPEGDTSNETNSDGWTLEDSIILSVQYQPKLKLELGNRMLSEQTQEGSDIFFVCSADAQPAVTEISWLHNDRPIGEDPAGGGTTSGGGPTGRSGASATGRPIMSNNSLVLQKVRLNQRGKYTCMASNSEGVSVSNSIELRVLHAPLCVGSQTTFGGKPSEQQNEDHLLVQSVSLPLKAEINLDCAMSAEPVVGTHFTWYLNNSHNERRVIFDSEAKETAHNRSQEQVAVSQLRHWTIETALDYGRLYCVASNVIGQQKRACVYQIDALPPGGSQSDVQSSPGLTCLPVNVTSGSAWIGCHVGSANRMSGEPSDEPPGTKIKFHVLLHRNKPARSSVQLTSDEFDLNEQPNVFELAKLRPNSNYLLEISALSSSSSSSFGPTKLNKEVVQFKTLDTVEAAEDQDDEQVAQIRAIPALNNNQSDLVASALQQISTRSANSRDLMSSATLLDSSLGHLRQQSRLSANTTSIWSSLSRLFGRNLIQDDSSEVQRAAPLASRRLLKGQVAAPAPATTSTTTTTTASKLMDLASDSLLVGSMCLVLLVTLLTLLLVRRLAFRCSKSAAHSSSIERRYKSSPIKLNAMHHQMGENNSNKQSSSAGSNSGSSEADYGPKDHQVGEQSSSSVGYGTSTIRMHLNCQDSPGASLELRQQQQQQQQRQQSLTYGLNMMATSSLQRRHQQPRERPASVQLQRMAAVVATANNNNPGEQLLNNNGNPKTVYEMPAVVGGQVNVNRSRSSLSFGGSASSMAGLGQPPRLIHLSGQQHHQQQQQLQQPLAGPPADAQQEQAGQVLISDANAPIFNQRPVNEIDLSLHQSHQPEAADGCWLAGPYIELAGSSLLDEAHNINNNNNNNDHHHYQTDGCQFGALSGAGRCHVRGQQEQEAKANILTSRRAPVAARQVASSASDNSDSNLVGVAVCSCDESLETSDYLGQTSKRRPRPRQLANLHCPEFILTDGGINHRYSLMGDESSDHSSQVAPNHHNHHHQHHLIVQRQHLAYGQAAQGDLIQLVANVADRLEPNSAFARLDTDNNNNNRQNPRKRQVANVGQQLHFNNHNNYSHQQSLMSGSPSTGTNTTTTTTTNRAAGSSPGSIESSGATLSQDQPIDLLQQLGQSHTCNDNESLDEHTSANSNSNNSRPMNNSTQQQQQRHLASILKNSQRTQTNLNNDDNQGCSSSPMAKLMEFPNECQCNGSSSNNNESSTNL